MKRLDITQQLLDNKLVVILRTKVEADIPIVLGALAKAGIKVLEITSNTPNFAEHIVNARLQYPDMLIGAGTIMTKELAHEAIEAGAQFLVTPNVSKEVLEYAHQYEVPIVMGALTPSEVVQALTLGADIIKLFPAEVMGIPYLKALKGPYDTLPLFAVGGIGIEEAEDWFEAGIHGLGIGGKLTDLSNGPTGITESARALLSIIDRF